MKGAIAGDCRDLSRSCGYTNYATRGRDSYLALNGVKVTLKNSSGAIVSVKTWSAKSGDDASYYPSTQANPQTTDNFNNGVFFFDELTAGTYTVEVSKTGYANQSKTVTVSNNNITKCCFDMKQGTSTGITPSVTMWEASANVGATATKSVTVTGTGLSANITLAITGTNANQFSLSRFVHHHLQTDRCRFPLGQRHPDIRLAERNHRYHRYGKEPAADIHSGLELFRNFRQSRSLGSRLHPHA